MVFNGGSTIDPDSRVIDPGPDKQNLEYVAKFLRMHMPDLSTTPVVAEKGVDTVRYLISKSLYNH